MFLGTMSNCQKKRREMKISVEILEEEKERPPEVRNS
jgi:hypothetical protein